MGNVYMSSKVVRSEGLGWKREYSMCGKKYLKLCTVLSYLGLFTFCTCCILGCLACIVVSCLVCLVVVVCIVVILCVCAVLCVYCCFYFRCRTAG